MNYTEDPNVAGKIILRHRCPDCCEEFDMGNAHLLYEYKDVNFNGEKQKFFYFDITDEIQDMGKLTCTHCGYSYYTEMNDTESEE